MILYRERVNSVTDLRVGDHIEWPAASVGLFVPGAQHHMFVSKVDGSTCSVIHRYRKGRNDSAREEDLMAMKDAVKYFEDGKVFRVIYPEHTPTVTGCTRLQEVMNAVEVSTNLKLIL